MSSSPPPESGHEKETEASAESGNRKEAEEVTLKPVKPEAAAEDKEGGGAYVSITITSQTAPDVFVRVKRDLTLQRVIDEYCANHSLDPMAVVFLNEEGKHIRGAQTAEEVGLEDGDSISVNIAQLGGSGRASV